MYSVTYFKTTEEVEVVPSSWFGTSKMSCRFPHNVKGSALSKAIEKCVEVDDEWPEYHNVSVLRETDDYQKARQKCKKIADKRDVNFRSDLDTTDCEGNARKRSNPTRFSDSEIEVLPQLGRKIRKKNKEHNRSQSDGSRKSALVACPNLPPMPGPSSSLAREQHHTTPSNPSTSTPNISVTLPDDELPLMSISADEDKTVYTVLCEIKLQVSSNNLMLRQLMQQQKSQPELEFRTEMIEKLPLPMANFEDVTHLDSLLEDKTLTRHLVAYLSTFGGRSSKNIVERIMKKLLSNSLATLFNWGGKRGPKRGLSGLRVAAVIKEACKKNGVKEAPAEDAIKVWLKNSSDRNGGRKKREEKKREKELENLREFEKLLHTSDSDTASEI